MQFQADLLGVPVVLSSMAETTALGAAFLAGLSCGIWKNTAEVTAHWKAGDRYDPIMGRDEAATRMERWNRAVRHAHGWVNEGHD